MAGATKLSQTMLTLNGTSITGIMSGFLSMYGSAVVPTSNSVIQNMTIKGLLPRVGGVIYYINSNSTNRYTFYDSNGNQVSAPSVGSDYSNYYYYKSGNDVDKYYVYNTSAMFKRDRTGKELDPYICWAYLSTGNQSFIDNANYTSGLPSGKQEYEYYGHYGRVYETLDSYTSTAIGAGKTNTLNMMSLRGGVYIQGSNLRWKEETTYSETIWSICNLFNKGLYSLNGSSVPNTTGCNDWYIPSKDELETMKNAIGASNFASMLYSGYVSSVQIDAWSSSANSNVMGAWRWFCQFNDDMIYSNSRYHGDDSYCLALTRSF